MKWLSLILAICCCAVPLRAPAKAAYAGKTEMIQRAEVIAVVTITKVEPTKTKREGWTYSEVATAKVEQVLKGKLDKTAKLYGGEDFICAQVHYRPGRYVVFLGRDNDLLVGANWHLGVREIKDGTVEWFKDEKSLDLEPAKLSEVLKDIASTLEKQKGERDGK